jgi:hypothetical protein
MKNIKLSKFTLLQVQMWDSSICHALSWIFMKKYQSFKFHPFPGSNVIFKYYSCAFMNFHEKKNFQSSFFPSSDLKFKYYLYTFMNFHEKISNFQSSFFSQFRCEIQVLHQKFHALSWIFMKKYQTFKVRSFTSSDVRFKYFSCAFMNFHVKISNFQSSFFSKFRCEIKVFFVRFHEFSW